MTAKHYWFNIRVDEIKIDDKYSQDSLDKLLSFKNKIFHECTKILIVQEVASITKKLHYHSTFKLKEEMKKETFFKRVKRWFPHYVKGSISNSIVKKPKENILYLCKDGTVIYCKGFDKEKILAESKIYNDKLKQKKGIVNNILNNVKTKLSEGKEKTKYLVIQEVHDYYVDKDLVVDYRVMRNKVNTIWAKLDREDSLGEFLSFCI